MHLHHLAIGTKEVHSLARFYRDVFLLKERARQSDELGMRSIWLELDSGVLMVERLDGPAHPQEFDAKGMHGGLFLIAFQMSDAERDDVEGRIEKAGGRIESRTTFTTYARDPDGNRIAVSSHSLVI